MGATMELIGRQRTTGVAGGTTGPRYRNLEPPNSSPTFRHIIRRLELQARLTEITLMTRSVTVPAHVLQDLIFNASLAALDSGDMSAAVREQCESLQACIDARP